MRFPIRATVACVAISVLVGPVHRPGGQHLLQRRTGSSTAAEWRTVARAASRELQRPPLVVGITWPHSTPTVAPTPTVSATPSPGPTRPTTPRQRDRVGPVAPTPPASGDPKSFALGLVGRVQFSCVDKIFTHESHWRWSARNPISGAYGIPQALPKEKMASAGKDWLTNPFTQIRWGIGYMNSKYGSPCAAWAYWQRNGSY